MFSPFQFTKHTPHSSVFPCFTLFSTIFHSVAIHNMSSVVCQGLPSGLEPRLVEPCASRHRMSPPIMMPTQNSPDNENEDSDNDYDDSEPENVKNSKKGGWNFIQALTDPSYNATKEGTEQNDQVYVHPLVKLSASALSSKSLEMCTESLGCETGSDISSDEISSFSWEREKMQLPSDDFSSLDTEKSQKLHENSSSLSVNNRSSYRKFTKLSSPRGGFPPPLTSISGSEGVEVRHHREGGRLIINAVAVSSCRTFFEADRTNGRLRLSLRRECSANCDCMTSEKDEEVFEEVHETKGDEQVLKLDSFGELAEDEVDQVAEDCWDEDVDETERRIDCEIGLGEFPRPSRCKEGGRGGKGMSNWGPFWVAIS
ncbi:hypothetical protein ACET3Z_019251 [Daucus carota]